VETTAATLPDCQALDSIHTALHARKVEPSEHLVDAGYMNSIQLADSTTKHQIDLFAPVPLDSAWQAHTADAFDIACFAVDWDAQMCDSPTAHTMTARKP